MTAIRLKNLLLDDYFKEIVENYQKLGEVIAAP